MSSFAELRKNKGISLAAAAQYIGVAEDTLQNMENNSHDIKISDAVMLADFYNEDIKNISF
ncbi:DNA-binding XRE family transcriptional regulator [Fontibacillus solani]|uniref:DNA-binding XRE family transcriptional regulator n=1 Tax=Fontibacillus solani TaxID=1572857 RepID=A0A7W3SUK0_9BACL|nr:helix-turn-helix transcriptional regulator [Fontibacillus solani]MBA9086454.1 DNA-binding XRE family transcriptional regulator [Fontibacillus solani]